MRTQFSLVLLLLLASCDDDNFSGNAKQKEPVSQNELDPNKQSSTDNLPGKLGEQEEIPIDVTGSSEKPAFLTQPLVPKNKEELWVVTTAGHIYNFRVEGRKVAEERRWTYPEPGGGSRTYVTDAGLVFCKNGPRCFVVHRDNTPQGAVSESWRAPGTMFHVHTRGCVVSYRKDNTRYIGIGWGDVNAARNRFAEFRISDTKPFAIDWKNPKLYEANTFNPDPNFPQKKWGYSCYIDQKKLIFYSQWVGQNQKPLGLNLNNGQTTDATVATNAGLNPLTLGVNDVKANTIGSYAISGGPDGNLFTGANVYTYALEKTTSRVWGVHAGALTILKKDCFTSKNSCLPNVDYRKYGEISVKLESGANAGVSLNLGTIGPLSALGNGRLAGLVRAVEGNGSVYIFSEDMVNGKPKLTATKIANLVGDPYMYTDFTGATLYASEGIFEYDLSEIKDFNANKVLSGLLISWQLKAGGADNLDGIDTTIRCYNDPANKPNFVNISQDMKASGKFNLITHASCRDKKFRYVELKLVQADGSQSLFENVKSTQITIVQ